MTADDLAKALSEACEEFTDEIKEKIENKINQIAEEAVEEVKTLAPVYHGKSKKISKGRYKKSWKYKIDKERGNLTATVYASGKQYNLTHLLENGHLNRDGTSRSKAFPHISIANENAVKKAEKMLEDL